MLRRYSTVAFLTLTALISVFMIAQLPASASDISRQVTISEGSSIPSQVTTPDVMTFRIHLDNNAQRLEDLQVRIVVLGPTGDEVLSTQQSGINVNGKSGQAVYWVWRTSADLPQGEYRLLASVTDKSGTRVFVDNTEVAMFELQKRTSTIY